MPIARQYRPLTVAEQLRERRDLIHHRKTGCLPSGFPLRLDPQQRDQRIAELWEAVRLRIVEEGR